MTPNSDSFTSSDASEKDGVIYITPENAPQQEREAIPHSHPLPVQDRDNDSDIDKNKPNTFLSSDDLEKVTDSQIYPQKRLFSFLHSKKIPPIPQPEERKVYPLYHTNIIYRIFFWWVFPIMRVGYKRTLQPNDLWAMDDRISIETLYKDFTRHLNRYIKKAREDYLKEHPDATEEELSEISLPKLSLLKTLLWTFKWQFSLGVLAMCFSNAASAFNPMLTKRLITFVGTKALDPSLPVNKGVGYAIGSCLIMLTNGVLFNHFFHNSMMTGSQAKAILIKAILDKSFKLSGYSKHKFPNGKITSLMTTDLSRLELALVFQPFLVAFPVSVIICIVLLIVNLGPIALVGIGIFIMSVFIAVLTFKRMIKVRISANAFTDRRVTFMREILSSMKMIKYYAWEDAYEENVEEQRSKEIRRVRIMQLTRNFVTAMAIALPNVSSMVTFLAMYKVRNNGRSPSNIFSSLSLFQVLSIQMFFLPMALSTGIDGLIALDRIQGLLEAAEEIQDVDQESLPTSDKNTALQLVDASFEWENFEVKDAKETTNEKGETFEEKPKGADVDASASSEKASFSGFKNLNFQIQKGELVIITGSIGTGKSSLLNALAGFMKKTEGDIFKNGSLLLCGYPWIQNTTVRDNILFGSSFDDVRYKEVIRVCALQADLDILPAGDFTEIGERGITLSGGQKARINLARSVYKSMDIYLFDDVLSAVDARVGKHIMDECLMGMLDGKTRILATHQLSLIERASRVIFLGAGGSFDIGTVEELKERNSGFVKLMEFSTQTKSANQREEVDDHAEENSGQNHQQEIAKLEKQISKKSNSEKTTTDGRLISKEERAVNSINLKIYKEYIVTGCGKKGIFTLPLYFFLIVATTFTTLFSSVWLSFWTENKFPGRSSGFYIGLYIFFVFVNYFFMSLQFTILCYIGLTASKWLNLKAVKRLLHTPMSFMDTTPLGRVLNRFTKDTDTLDNELTESVRLFVYQTANIAGVIIMCIIYLPWFAIAVPFLGLIFILVADHYQSSGREIKRLEAVQRSFVYNNFNEVLSGMDTIKAYKSENRFLMKSDFLINRVSEAGYLVVAVQRWVSISLDMIAVAFALIITLLCVTRQFDISAASVGVLLTYVLQLPGLLNGLLRAMTQAENDMNSVERIVNYATELPQEAAYRKPEMTPQEPWPSNGEVVFDNVSLSYRPGLPLVLKGVSLNIKGGEKIGICGRTGAGKSTIMSALYRLCELNEGRVLIDGVDTSKLGLYDLRRKLSIIPQDPVLFKGSIRKNLDPFGEREDEELWSALVRSGTIEAEEVEKVKNQHRDESGSSTGLHKFHLDQEVEDDGTNFSLGERQLLALTRALVRQSKILILDEATSSVDYETDAKIQLRIVQEFNRCTILCIAHRLKTILNYDRIIVLDKGEVKEFDTPWNLFCKHDTIFREMCERSGILAQDFPGEQP